MLISMHMLLVRLVAAAMIVAGAVSAAHAGPFSDRAAEAEALAGSDATAAAAVAREAFADFIGNLPFQMVNAVFVAEPAGGFGMQKEGDSAFDQGEKVIVYCEPIGLTWVKGGRGFTSSFSVDVEVVDKAGKVLGGQKDFGTFNFDSKIRNQEVMTHLTLSLDGLPAGEYGLTYYFKDRNSGKATSISMPFSINP